MIITLDSNDKLVLQTWKCQGKWELELIERSTGMVQILVCDTKEIALKTFRGMELDEIAAFMDKVGAVKCKVYKKNYRITG